MLPMSLSSWIEQHRQEVSCGLGLVLRPGCEGQCTVHGSDGIQVQLRLCPRETSMCVIHQLEERA